MTSAQIKKQNRIAKLQSELKANNEMIEEAKKSIERKYFVFRSAKDIEMFNKDNQRIYRNLARLGVK